MFAFSTLLDAAQNIFGASDHPAEAPVVEAAIHTAEGASRKLNAAGSGGISKAQDVFLHSVEENGGLEAALAKADSAFNMLSNYVEGIEQRTTAVKAAFQAAFGKKTGTLLDARYHDMVGDPANKNAVNPLSPGHEEFINNFLLAALPAEARTNLTHPQQHVLRHLRFHAYLDVDRKTGAAEQNIGGLKTVIAQIKGALKGDHIDQYAPLGLRANLLTNDNRDEPRPGEAHAHAVQRAAGHGHLLEDKD